ncbi:MAG: fumarate reductase (quinol) flavoprotein subunit [Sedimenticolaceae bacterium]
MQQISTDIVIVGAGGAGLRTAIAIADSDPDLKVALISKVYPMRSHTCAAEGGAAAVIKPDDSLDLHFDDTVGGGDWLSDQDVVEYFVNEAPTELLQLDHWGCPWSREPDGSVAVRPFGGMKMKRTWFAADKSGFHILHTLFQTSLKHPGIERFDEFFSIDLLVDDGRCRGVVAMEMKSGQMYRFEAKAVILATGGAGRMFPFSTNGAIKTGDGTAMAYRAGVPTKDMEFVQYHPTGLLSTGILLTEGCRGEGGVLLNKDGRRYLQDYGMGPETPLGETVLKTMELGPRDRLSQAFWHEQQKGNTIPTRWGESVYLDMTHLGEKLIDERLPLVRDLSITYAGVDPVKAPVPVRPVVHYMMGGIHTNIDAETTIPGLFAVGETACASLNGANRLGSNSLTELLVFGKRAAARAVEYVRGNQLSGNEAALQGLADRVEAKVRDLIERSGGTESIAGIRKEMAHSLETGAGIYRTEKTLQETCDTIGKLRKRYRSIELHDKSNVFNTDLIQALELGNLLELAQTVAEGALARKESRGSHQRLDFVERDDDKFLKHTLAYYQGEDAPRIDYHDVVITKSQPGVRDYSGGAK